MRTAGNPEGSPPPPLPRPSAPPTACRTQPLRTSTCARAPSCRGRPLDPRNGVPQPLLWSETLEELVLLPHAHASVDPAEHDEVRLRSTALHRRFIRRCGSGARARSVLRRCVRLLEPLSCLCLASWLATDVSIPHPHSRARAHTHTHTGTRLRAHWASHFAAALAPDPAIGAASLGRVRRAPPRRSRRARRCTARLRLRARALVLRGLALRPLVRAEFGLSAPLSESYAARSAATSAHAGVCVILIVTV
jgi:hypothetical protein